MQDDSDKTRELNDLACLRRFARDGSQDAFTKLVRRRIDLVYSAAVRQVGDKAMAEDVTQIVFIALARKAASIANQDLVVSAWLLHATRLCALDALKRSRRRTKHEQRAAQMASERQAQLEDQANERMWAEVRPLLDAAIAGLGETDRRAIVLRYFEDRSLREVGEVLGVSEEAARQRVWRAVERLRGRLGAKGAGVTTAALGPALAVQAVQAAPAALAGTVSNAAISAAAAKVAIPLGWKGAVQLMAWTKAQMAGAAAVAAVLLAGGTVATVAYVNRPPREQAVVLPAGAQPPPQSVIAPRQPQPITPMPPGARERFNQLYALADGQSLKRVKPPIPPERIAYLDESDNQRFFDHKSEKDLFVFQWDGKQAGMQQWTSAAPTVGLVIHSVIDVPSYKIDIADEDQRRAMPGDWVIRQGATVEQKFVDLAGVLNEDLQWPVRFEQRTGPRPVIVAHGSFSFKPLNESESKQVGEKVVHLYIGTPPKRTNGMAIGDLNGFLRGAGEAFNREFILEGSTRPATAPAATGEPRRLDLIWSNHLPRTLSQAQMAEALRNLSAQTGFTYTLETRVMPYWAGVVGSQPAAGR